jgi:hypothetical protein
MEQPINVLVADKSMTSYHLLSGTTFLTITFQYHRTRGRKELKDMKVSVLLTVNTFSIADD